MPAETKPAQATPGVAVLVGLTLLGLLAIGINAWLCDDAFITLRSVKHLVEGHGPVFNVGWRVQSYTHPAWMLLLALAWALTREAFWTTITVALLTSAAALGVGLRGCRGWLGALVCVVAISCSRAFVEFSTGGLENPLTHLVIAAGAWLLVREDDGDARRRLVIAGLLCSAAFGSRPDAVLLLAPVWLELDRRARVAGVGRRARVSAWVLGALPMLGWELFSLIYYGALVPNTALAKLAGGILRSELIGRGLAYVWHSAIRDPATLVLLLAAVIVPWLPSRCGADRLRPLALGAAGYLAYVIAIGGDYMAGRFLTAPAWIGALALGRLCWSVRVGAAAVLVWPWLAGLGTRHPWWPDPGSDEPRPRHEQYIDERSHYAKATSVLGARPGRSLPEHTWREQGERGPADGARVVSFSTMGFYGYYADTQLHIVDHFALADPLLAHLPPVRRVDWKAGHMARVLPDGYLATLAGDPWRVKISDPAVAHLYEVVARVHHGPVFGRGRARAVFELISGRAAAGIDERAWRLAELVQLDARRLAQLRKPLRFRDAGFEISLGERPPASLVMRLSPGQRYAVMFMAADGRELARHEFEVTGEVDGALHPVELALPDAAVERVHVLPLTMHDKRSLVVMAGP